MNKKLGFSLAELLIAMGILGSITTFTIPKVLIAVNDSQKTGIVKEAIAALSELTYMGMLSGQVSSVSTATNYIKNNMNYVKWCDDITTDGCRTVPTADAGHSNKPGFTLANGAIVYLSFYTSSSILQLDFIIDWNNNDLPNVISTNGDTIYVKGNFTGTARTLQTGWCTSTTVIKPGQLTFACDTTHKAIFEAALGLD